MRLIGCERRMARRNNLGRLRKSQEGYALLLVIFLVVILTLTVTLATPNLLTQQRREKEEEMIWRGKQYARAVNLYYRKEHRFPLKLEDLYEERVGVRFLRRAYKDPMNASDGSWRLIYVAPDGRIVGSLRENHNTNLFAFAGLPPQGSQGSIAANSSSSATSSATAAAGAQNSTTSAQGSAQGTPPPSTTPSTSPTPSAPTSPQSLLDSSSNTAPQVSSAGDSALPRTNQIIGVGSKIDRKSIRLLDREKNYLQFEFIWNPNDSQNVVVH
jgi:type II secretory pathway pseudopilin PulG